MRLSCVIKLPGRLAETDWRASLIRYLLANELALVAQVHLELGLQLAPDHFLCRHVHVSRLQQVVKAGVELLIRAASPCHSGSPFGANGEEKGEDTQQHCQRPAGARYLDLARFAGLQS